MHRCPLFFHLSTGYNVGIGAPNRRESVWAPVKSNDVASLSTSTLGPVSNARLTVVFTCLEIMPIVYLVVSWSNKTLKAKLPPSGDKPGPQAN